MSHPKHLPLFAAASAAGIFAFAAPAASGQPAKHVPAAPARPRAIAAADPRTNNIGLVMGIDKNTYAVSAAPSVPANAPAARIHAILTFFNNAAAPLRIAIGGLPCRWQILDAQGTVVWDYATGRLIPHFIRIVTLQHNTLSFRADLPLQTQDGTPLAPGRYTLRGAVPAAMGASASLDFTVTR